jgi:hypothetical protein
MHKSATKCNETVGKWCKNKHGASKIIDTFETYHMPTLDDDMFAGVEDFEDFVPPSEPEGADGDEDARGEEEREGSPILSEDF